MTATCCGMAPRDILGNLEVRRLAGRSLGHRKPVTRATLIRWRELKGFPDPFRTVSSGELWDRRAVLLWLQEHNAPEVDAGRAWRAGEGARAPSPSL